MARPIDAILTRLQTRGVGVKGTTLFQGTGADIPNSGTIIIVTETGGPGPMETQNAGSIKQPSFQVVAQSNDPRLVGPKIDAAYLALGGSDQYIRNVSIDGIFWLWIKPMSEPFVLPPNANGNSRAAFNVESCRR